MKEKALRDKGTSAQEALLSTSPSIHARTRTESFGFWHPPTEVWLTEDQKAYRICDESGEDPSCSDRYYVVRQGLG